MTETQKYAVVSRRDGFEVRRYEAHVVAEVVVPGPAENAGNRAFRALVGYIGGANDTGRSVAMTAPVLQQPSSSGRPIAMTAPVLQQQADGEDRFLVGFVMPAGETLETLPAPRDPDVVLRAVPEQLMVAARYSGVWSHDRYDEHAARLLDDARADGFDVTGPPQWARYDPPWKPWFLRRNEVLLPVAEPDPT